MHGSTSCLVPNERFRCNKVDARSSASQKESRLTKAMPQFLALEGLEHLEEEFPCCRGLQAVAYPERGCGKYCR